MNAFCNVRLQPLQNLKIKDIINASEEEETTTIISFGKHKTGRKCPLTMPNELFTHLKNFVDRIRQEQNVIDDTPVRQII